MSFNAQNLSYIYEDKELRTAHMNTFFEEMNNFENVDILCTQEMGVRSNELMEKRTNFIHIYAPEDVGPVIFSQHPIVNKGQIHSSTSTVNSCVWADININGITYRIYNLHMQSNKITRTAEKVIEDSKLQNKETWNGIKSIITRYRDNANFRIEHAERIRAHMLESPYPVIVAGDFNDVPQSYLYHILSTGMQDSFKAVGSGLGITFSGKIPALRIDYILADQDFRILNHKILKNEFSDHYPITTILNLKPQ
jgi:endonuclease/exonuclease/phosphatase family metal-dependent hydrolase